MSSQKRQPSPSSPARATRPQLPRTHCWSRDTTHTHSHTNPITNTDRQHTNNISSVLPHKRMLAHICSRAHLLRGSAFGGPRQELVPKMAGASRYWSQGADLCQGLTHSTLLRSAHQLLPRGSAHTTLE